MRKWFLFCDFIVYNNNIIYNVLNFACTIGIFNNIQLFSYVYFILLLFSIESLSITTYSIDR